MSRKKVTSQEDLSPQEAASFLRNLAQALEKGHLNLQDVDLDWEKISKLKLELKNIDGHIKLKTKVKPEAADSGPKDQKVMAEEVDQVSAAKTSEPAKAKTGFKPLKKMMQKTLASIEAPLQHNEQPALADVQALADHAGEMLQYAGQNLELYNKFQDKTRELLQAAQEANLTQIQALVLVQDIKQ